jgi:hypothetical protein
VHLVLQTAPNLVSLTMPFGFNALVTPTIHEAAERGSERRNSVGKLTTTRHVLTIQQGGDLNCAARWPN